MGPKGGNDTMANRNDRPVLDDMVNGCVALRLRFLNRVVTNLYDDALRPLGLTIGQLNLLVVTAKLGLAQPAMVCDLLQLDTSTLSRNVERMRANGWLEAVPGEDARTQPFRLTTRGRKLLERAAPAWEQAQRRATEALGDEGVTRLADAACTLGLLRVDQ
jgi:DNA-binding MarR family transcriptional regulator